MLAASYTDDNNPGPSHATDSSNVQADKSGEREREREVGAGTHAERAHTRGVKIDPALRQARKEKDKQKWDNFSDKWARANDRKTDRGRRHPKVQATHF